MQRVAYILILLLLATPCRAEVTAVGAAYQDGNGWTQLTANGDTFYVSSSVGNDDWDGTAPAFVSGTTGPKATLLGGRALISTGDGDHLLLKRGDTWTDETLGGGIPAGGDEDSLTLIGAYGTGNRPVIAGTAGQDIVSFTGGTKGNYAFIGIEFRQNNRQMGDGGNGISTSMTNGYGNLLVEDCKFVGLGVGLDIQASPDTSANFDGVTVRRCIFDTCHSGVAHSQSIFMTRLQDILIEENVFYHSGWTDDWYDTAIMGSGTTPAYTNGDTITITCIRGGDYTIDSEANPLDLELIDTNDATGTITSVTIVGDDIEVRADFTTGVASNTVAAAIQAFNGGADFACVSSGTANLVAADVGIVNGVLGGSAHSSEPTIFNHHIYISEGGQTGIHTRDVTIRRNVFCKASNHCVKLETTEGTADVYDNLMVADGTGGQWGVGSVDIETEVQGFTLNFYNNVIMEGLATANSGWLGPEFQNVLGGYCRNNIVAHRTASTGAQQFLVNDHTDGVGINDFAIDSNVFYNIFATARFRDPTADAGYTAPTISGNSFTNNVCVVSTGETTLQFLLETDWLDSGEMTYSGNTWFSTSDTADEWFEVEDVAISTATWQSTYEADATFTEPTFTDATRTPTTFATTHANGYADLDEWITDLLSQDSQGWDESIMAAEANDWIRGGYGVSEYDPGASIPDSSKLILMLK